MSTWVPTSLPEDLDAERALISTLAATGALDPGSGFADAHHAILTAQPEHFVHPKHKVIFEALQALYSDAQEVNCLSLKAQLESIKKLGRVGGFPGLVEILAGDEVSRPTALVERLIDLWRLRQLLAIGGKMTRLASSQDVPVDDLVSDLAGQLSQLSRGKDASRIMCASGLLDRLVTGEAFRDPEAGGKLIWFGIPAFDGAIEGSPRHVVMIAARPGIGKSALAVQSQWETAKKGIPSLLISLEMDKDEVESRYASWLSGEGQRTFRSGGYSDSSVHALFNARQTLDLMHHWCHPSGVQWSKVEAVIRDSVRVHGVRVVFIDHVLLLAKPTLGKSVNDAACWTALSRGLKRIAQELGIGIVSLCQLNRSGDGVEPKLSDLKESGGWEEDANAVVMLWPKDAKAVDGPLQESMSVMGKVAKNRSGAGGWKRELSFMGATSRFIEVERKTDLDPHGRGRFEKALL